ncbi:hypothetical protein HYPSUDRAFT_61710 [Hypholoma sublateritium FD-334 SS-4]|uniref:Major facilitator superfamily (MFS) profile domain-containing protein n=1 Tax=Hypholoma sublateritium (strain FD-334 SS-4) TaxID=945553 RepID=A0A0D2QB22_HYPSF|nr:hypothetical protein HYPSUDRAFT_61710 [Hypholoma sublateritium FD-334 SS-4]
MAQSYTSSDEKEKGVSDGSSVTSPTTSEDVAFERKTMRYIDYRIIPILALAYSFALIDRVNLGSAYTAGLGAEFNLQISNRFNIISCVSFVPYILLNVPGSLVLRYFGVRNWLAAITLAWGAVQLSMGYIHSWHLLVLCRVLLGTFEASFFPSMILIISTWYTRHEVQKRIAVFYILSVTASGFSPLLAYALSLLNGKRHISGWRWIFIIEGAITMFLAVITYLFIPAFPDQNSFLTPKQTELVLKRIDNDRGDATPDPITYQRIMKHLSEWTIWVYGLILMCAALPSYALSFFLPIILRDMGYSKTNALLLSAAPYGPPIITTMLIAYFSDKHKHRASYIVGCAMVCITGLSLTAFAHHNHVRYLGVFLTTAGNLGSAPAILAYSSNNVVSQSKKNVQSSLTISVSGIGGIIATTVFRSQDAPRYIPGLSVAMASQAVLAILVGVLTVHFMRENRLVREGKKVAQGQPGFYYTL